MYRPTLRLTLDCDNRCVFCAQRGLAAAGALALAERLQEVRAHDSEITFTGGEPTLHPELETAIVQAREAGFLKIGLQTNARRLSDARLLGRLIDAGLTDVHVSLHGATPALHDHLVGVEGAFAQTLSGINEAHRAGLVVVATTVLTRSNHRVLAPMPRLLKASGVSAWLLEVPRTAGAAGASFGRSVPRLALALPFALQALSHAHSLHLHAFLRGAPLCALGPLAVHVLPEPGPRRHAPACASCPSRARCPGLDAAYLERFGGDELRPVDAPVAHALALHLVRQFVGVGEEAPPLPRESLLSAQGAPALRPLGRG